MFNGFVDQFETKIKELQNQDFIEEKRAHSNKLCEAEIEKYEKVLKKIKNDMEDYTGPGATNFKVVRDKILAENFKPIKKMNEELNSISIKRSQLQSTI